MKVGTVGVLAEDRDKDRRVALVPDGVRRLARSGLAVLVETGAGAQHQDPGRAGGAGRSDEHR